jgi:hypothetical protein
MRDTSVDPEQLLQSAQQISQGAQQIGQLFDQLSSQLDSFGECWGNDDIGSLIGMVYTAIKEVAVEAFKSNVQEILDYGQGIQEMAQQYLQVDQSGEDIFKNLASY